MSYSVQAHEFPACFEEPLVALITPFPYARFRMSETESKPEFSLARRLVSEIVGTTFLLAAVVGSGIMSSRLSPNNEAIALLANTLATGAALVALILTFGPISGAHFNPIVTLTEARQGSLAWKEVPAYAVAQILGASLGVLAAHVMFDVPLFQLSTHARSGVRLMVSEGIATFGLIAVILSCSRSRPSVVPFAVAMYISAAYWFTSSTSFANPAATLARSLTNTSAGIHLHDTLGFIVGQGIGAFLALTLFTWLVPTASSPKGRV